MKIKIIIPQILFLFIPIIFIYVMRGVHGSGINFLILYFSVLYSWLIIPIYFVKIILLSKIFTSNEVSIIIESTVFIYVMLIPVIFFVFSVYASNKFLNNKILKYDIIKLTKVYFIGVIFSVIIVSFDLIEFNQWKIENLFTTLICSLIFSDLVWVGWFSMIKKT